MDMVSKNAKRCVLCKHWNGAVGSTTLKPRVGGMTFEFDGKEKQTCFHPKKCIPMNATSQCQYFEARYKY